MSKTWSTCELGTLFELRSEKSKQIKATEYLESGDLPVIDQSEHSIAGYIDDHARAYSGRLPVIVFGDHTRATKFIDFPFGAGADGTQILAPVAQMDARFLYYVVSRSSLLIGNYGYDRHLKHLRRFKICFPISVAEQRRIAEILSTLDRSIDKTEALIAKYQQIKAGLMHDLFTRGVTADGKLRPPREQAPELYQETPIGWIPKEWGCRKLGEILNDSGGYLQTGPFGSQLHAHEYTDGGIPVVMPQDIEDGEIFTHAIARIPESRAQFLARHRVKLRDIIIARRGELSRAATISQEKIGWVCGTGCFLLRLSGSKLDPRFFSYAYRHDIVQRQIEGLAVGSTMPSLNNSVMSSLYFPYLTEDEQHRISDRLETQDKALLSLKYEKEKLEKQKTGLMHDLLTGKVKVKIHGQENTI